MDMNLSSYFGYWVAIDERLVIKSVEIAKIATRKRVVIKIELITQGNLNFWFNFFTIGKNTSDKKIEMIIGKIIEDVTFKIYPERIIAKNNKT